MDKVQLCESLMKWLQTFDVDAPHNTIEEVSDGVAMAQALTQIAPEWFGDAWMSKIKTDTGNNWRLKVSNLKKIVEGIVDYYHDSINQHLADFNKPDVNKIGEKCDPAELGRLLQLILGCAINCNHKQEYITRIMSMEESVQQVIMQSIQELENNSSHGSVPSSIGTSIGIDSDPEPQVQKLQLEIELATEARDQMAQRCHELDMQVTLLQEEKGSVLMENKRLHERLKEFENLDDPSGTGHRYKELRKQVDILKEELFKMETSRDDYRVKAELLEKELSELQSKVEELQRMADEAQHLKDEVDVLRETADMVGKYEATIESYKKRLEEHGDLRRQLKILEEKNTDYVQQNMELEEEMKKNSVVKSQLELYKKQVAELDHRLNEETKRADKEEFECKKLQERLNAIQREKERLIVERDSLKETNEEMKCSQQQLLRGVGPTGAPDGLMPESVTENMIPPEVKERLVRLQHENKILRSNQRSQDDENVQVLKEMLESSKERVSQLRQEKRNAQQRILELESQVEEMQERDGGGGAGLRQHLTDMQSQLRAYQREKEALTSQVEERDVSLNECKQKIASLQDSLRQKESEMQKLEEQHKRNIEKAKTVIKTLDPKQNPGPAAEVAVLRNQVLEKDKIIEDMEEEKEQNKAFRDIESKLMITAFYRLGGTRQRESVDHRLEPLSSGQNQSFLARQRQAAARIGPVDLH